MNRRLTATVVVLAMVMLAACGSDSDASTEPDPFSAAGTGLCQAADAADRPTEARQVFFDTVHQPLHELAAQTGSTDRSVAADLLEAKQHVEAAFGDDGSSLPGALDELVETTNAALRTLDRPELACGSNR